VGGAGYPRVGVHRQKGDGNFKDIECSPDMEGTEKREWKPVTEKKGPANYPWNEFEKKGRSTIKPQRRHHTKHGDEKNNRGGAIGGLETKSRNESRAKAGSRKERAKRQVRSAITELFKSLGEETQL